VSDFAHDLIIELTLQAVESKGTRMKHAGMIILTAIAFAAVWPAGAQAAKWSLQSAPIPAGAHDGELASISCAPTKACMAVGAYNAHGLPFADEEEAGKWTVRSMPTPTGVSSAEGLGVSCFSWAACVAVGEAYSTAYIALAEFWNGTSWTVESPVQPAEANLRSVSCIRAYACFAVGEYLAEGKIAPLAEERSGSEWFKMKVPDPTGSEFARLTGVSCTYGALYTCTAVGFTLTAGVQKQFAERYNGHEWSIISTITPTGSVSAGFSSVACYGVNECLAVGHYETSTATKTLIERLSPTFTILENSSNSGSSTTLGGVSCPTSEGCLAVGWIGSSSGPFSEHWTGLEGEEWVNISTPAEPSSRADYLESVSCPAVSSCVAVGGYYTYPSGEQRPLAERYE
jgi:hypothetical protein